MSKARRTLIMQGSSLPVSLDDFQENFQTASTSIECIKQQFRIVLKQQEEMLDEYDRRAKEWN